MARGASRVVRIKWCGYGGAVDSKEGVFTNVKLGF